MKRVIVITLLVIGFFILKTVYQAGQFKSISNEFNGIVETIYSNVPGPEDMQIDYETGQLFISGAMRRNNDKSDDGIYVLKVDSDGSPHKIQTNFRGEFHPHGISLVREDSSLYLLAVNHTEKGNYVESFKVDKGELQHLASYSDRNVCCPNDLVATAHNKFYLSNDHGARKGVMRIIEDYLLIPRASIFYFDGKAYTKVASPFLYANGINLSKDKQLLYVAETTGASISTFRIDGPKNLQRVATLDVDTGVDNIDIDEAGNLWIAAHPKLLDFVNHSKDSTNLSPSQILKLIPQDNYELQVEQIYMNDGSELSGSSIAVPYRNELFVGVVFNHSVLRAKLLN